MATPRSRSAPGAKAKPQPIASNDDNLEGEIRGPVPTTSVRSALDAEREALSAMSKARWMATQPWQERARIADRRRELGLANYMHMSDDEPQTPFAAVTAEKPVQVKKRKPTIDAATSAVQGSAPATRPQAPTPRWDAIPTELREIDAWVVWRYEWAKSKWTKVPYSAHGGHAKTTDPSTWGSFEEARAAYEAGGFDGIGLILVEDLCGVDLDHVLVGDDPEAWAVDVVRHFEGCYVEVSPSGEGLRIFCRGKVARTGKGGPGNQLEAYDRSSPRYLTVTGQGEGEVMEAQPALGWLHETFMRKAEPAALTSTAPRMLTTPPIPDAALLRRARAAANGQKFGDLYDGRITSGDASSDDAALASMLSFWTQDAEQIERLMRGSGLARDKWNSRRGAGTYLSETIAKILEGGGERYEGGPGGTEQRRALQRQRSQEIGDGVAVPIPELWTLEEMRERLVFISDGSRVALRDAPQRALTFADFRNHCRASLTAVGRTLAETSALWLSDPARPTVHTLTFRPGQGEFTTDPEGVLALNLWKPRERSASDADLAPFLEHIAYLVPIDQERERFLDWLAHIEQQPGKLPHTAYLMVTPMTGIGRNWLGSLLARVWPGSTRLGFDLYGAMHSGFNGPLSHRLLVVVDELKAADATGYGVNVAQQLKSMLTTEHRTINAKYGRQHIEFNCARFLMFSQHYDALPLERNDRRVIVISNPTQRRSTGYYSQLYEMLDDADFVNAVGHWLARRDLSCFNPNEPAPLTHSKQQAIEASVGELEQALITLKESATEVVMLSSDIAAYLEDAGIAHVSPRALASAYAAVGFVPCTRLVTVDRKKRRVVSLRGDGIKDATAAHLLRLLGLAGRE